MSFTDIIQYAHKQLKLSDLKPLTKEVFNHNREGDFDTWKKSVTELGYDVSRIYTDGYVYYYKGEYSTPKLVIIDLDWLGLDYTKSVLKADEYGRKMLNEGNYFMYFFPEGNPFALDYFIKYIDEIPSNELYEVFINLYMLMESGFGDIPKEVLQKVFKEIDKTDIKDKFGEETKEIVIYRGEHRSSTMIENALSWTLKEDVARGFANRFEEGRVYKAKVSVDNIKAYISERNEEEVLVLREDIRDIEYID